ncbi:MAG: hypothetical protein QXQ54_08130 [Thermoplasmata archaeon]
MSTTNNCREYHHWVWVYGVESVSQLDPQNIKAFGFDQRAVKVYYTGDNLYEGMYKDFWPTGLYDGQNKVRLSFYLPWMSGYGDSSPDGKYRSTTRLVWEWKAYLYYPYGTQSVSATTRYYDYSP